ncbi:hypothetical protein FRC03_008762 [Tulasnella sp. 419]|nr:hypothetical protein FRC03_008762 [Tulasnella sp. 419]
MIFVRSIIANPISGFNVITPELDGTILPGVTRDSILQLASAHVVDHKSPDSLSTAEVVLPELHVQEKHLTMLEIVEYHERGVLTEAFGAGTAAILCPVSKIGYEERDLVLPEYKGGLGPVGRAMWERIVEIQEGRRPSPWSVEIDAERD